jgi:hypothetical protein
VRAERRAQTTWTAAPVEVDGCAAEGRMGRVSLAPGEFRAFPFAVVFRSSSASANPPGRFRLLVPGAASDGAPAETLRSNAFVVD